MEVGGCFASVIVWGGQSLSGMAAGIPAPVYCSLSQTVISIHLLKKHEAQLWLHFKYFSFQPFMFFFPPWGPP